MINHFIVPDTQNKKGVPTAHVTWAGRYIAEHRPDVIVILGDWWDYPSLSKYDSIHKKIIKGYTTQNDFNEGRKALLKFMEPWRYIKGYNPRMVFLEGNHEERVKRYVAENPQIDSIPCPLECARELRWEVHNFLHPVTINGVTYCHFFCKDANGQVMSKPKGQPNARDQATRERRLSTVAGHKQIFDFHNRPVAGGEQRAIIAGAFYQHHEGYKGPQGNDHWRGCLELRDVRNGVYNLTELRLDYLRRLYR